ncbi:MAG: alpha/beta hydrolase [Rhizobiaceae bacterium]
MLDWRDYERAELDRQYDARGSVHDFDAEIARYRDMSAQSYADCTVVADLAYGASAEQRIDYFPAGSDAPVLIFIHGGYWRLLGRSDSALMAGALARQGISTAVVEYTLAPEASLDQIVSEVKQAMVWIYANIRQYGGNPKNLVICGSSAGAHLSAMAMATDWEAEFGLPTQVLRGAMLLSGLYDLEPLIHCRPNQWLNLDLESARRNSPQFLPLNPEINTQIYWGGTETDEFKRQSRAFLENLQSTGAKVSGAEIADRNHFDIVTDLADPNRHIFKELQAMF